MVLEAEADQIQYYEMTGTRGLWNQGWKVVATHGSQPGLGHFDEDPWELYHVDEDRAEARDLAAERPEGVEELVRLWHEEAHK